MSLPGPHTSGENPYPHFTDTETGPERHVVYPGHGVSAQFVQEPKALTNLLWASLFPPTLVLRKYPETLSWDRLGDIQAALELPFAAFSVLTLRPRFWFPCL